MYKLEGIIPAMVTPFKEDYSIDEKGLQNLVEFFDEKGCSSVLVGGTTGEYTLLNNQERKKIIKLAVEAAKDKSIKIMANTGCHSTDHTIELTQYAEKIGADSVLILPTYYLKTTISGLMSHYKKISENVDIPIVIYHYPQGTGVFLDTENVLELSEYDNIIGIKNTAPMEHTGKLISLTRDNEGFNVVTGYEHLILSTLVSGGAGAIGIAHNIVPGELVKIFNLVKENKISEAIKINDKLLNLYDLMTEEPYPGPAKEALNQMGLPAGKPRLPVVPASKEMKNKLHNELVKLNLV